MKILYAAIPIALLLILGIVFFTVSSGDDDGTDDLSEETSATEEAEKPAEAVDEETGEPAEETPEADPDEENGEDVTSEETTEEPDEEQSDSSAGKGNYNAAEQCIMSELTECEGVSEADQFLAYDNLVTDGTLPQSPGSGCLPCAVKYSFEAEYGDSREIAPTSCPVQKKILKRLKTSFSSSASICLPCLRISMMRMTKHWIFTTLSQQDMNSSLQIKTPATTATT